MSSTERRARSVPGTRILITNDHTLQARTKCRRSATSLSARPIWMKVSSRETVAVEGHRTATGGDTTRRLAVVTGAERVCVDGIDSVEAVVIRRIRTGRLIGFNASAILVSTG